MSKPPLIRTARAKPPATLEIAWSRGETLAVEVSRLIKRFKLYAPLKNAALFGKARADPWGHAVNWPGEIDMGADQLCELARGQAGEWGHERFAAWMAGHGLSRYYGANATAGTRQR